MEVFLISLIVIVGLGTLIGAIIPTTPKRIREDAYKLKEMELNSNISEDIIFKSLYENKEKKDIDYKPKTKVTLNPLKWGKYTLIINSAEKKFTDIYNFQTPNEYKESNYLMLLSNTILFEEVRLNKLSPDNFGELLTGFSGDTTFHKLIKPVGDTFFDFESFISLYKLYIDYRAREVRPIVSTMVAFQSFEGTVSKDEIKKLSDEYEENPMFGRSV